MGIIEQFQKREQDTSSRLRDVFYLTTEDIGNVEGVTLVLPEKIIVTIPISEEIIRRFAIDRDENVSYYTFLNNSLISTDKWQI